MKKFKIPIVLLLLAVIAGGIFAWFFYWNKPQQNIKDASSVAVSANELFTNYSTNEQKANQSYIDKIVAVTGEVSSLTKNSEGKTVVMLKTNDPVFGVNCTMEQDAVMKTGETITLKGICTGYLTDVVVIRCYKVN
jgi:tRNA_anti-like